MRLKISNRNSKIGRMPNLSLPPGLSCVPGILCFVEGCYAQACVKRYPQVKKAWESNWDLYQKHPEIFFSDLNLFLKTTTPRRFRMSVGGDFPDEEFYYQFEIVCRNNAGTNFLAFTKRYTYDFSQAPDNLTIVLSTWPRVALPKNRNLPWAWILGDPRMKEKEFLMCPGGCDDCGHRCWTSLRDNLHVVFPKH